MSTETIQHLPYIIAKQHLFFVVFRNKTDLEKFLYVHNEFHHKSKISEVSVKRQGLGGLEIGQKN